MTNLDRRSECATSCLKHLRTALKMAKAAGARPQLLNRIRASIESAKGAERNAFLRAQRRWTGRVDVQQVIGRVDVTKL
jgi:hypothetical protein